MTDWIGTNRRSLAIIRISSRRQEGNISQDVQEREIRDYCAQNGLSLESIHKFTESGKDSDDRKKYAAAIAAALTQDIRHVLFYMYDREARNLTDNEKNEKLVRAGLLVLHYVRDHKVLHQDSSDSDYFIRDVQAVTSKQFIRNLTAKVNDAMKQKADTGWYPSNQLPLGYALQKLKDERGRELKRGAIVVRDPDEKRVRQVIREFELRAQGLTFNEIKSQIISEGFIPKGKVNQYRPNVIEARISNRFYEGVFLWKGVTYTGKHERIVPDSLIQAARAVGRGRKLRHRDPEGHGIFAGGAWFKCVCGCAIIYEPVRKIYRSGNVQTFHYYRCTNGKRAHQRKQYIREQLIWDQFTLAVESIQISDELAAKIAEALNATHRSVVTASNRKALELKRKIAELEKEEERDYQNFATNLIDGELYHKLRLTLRTRRAALNAELDRVQGAGLAIYRETAESVVELSKHAKDLYLSRSPHEKREFLEKLLSNPTLDGAMLRYDLKKPFDSLVNLNDSVEWRARLDKFLTDCGALQGGLYLEDMEFLDGPESD